MSSWEKKARQFLLDEEKEDDELFLVIVPAVLLAMQEEKRSVRTSGTSVHGSAKKRKKNHVASVLEDYLEHRKKQTEKTVEALLEMKSREEEYSIERCLDIVDALEELTDEEKAAAAEVFNNEVNREMFVIAKQKIPNVGLIWLRRKIRYVYIFGLPSSLKTVLNPEQKKNLCIYLFSNFSRIAST
jgi:lipopolysaccharide biosynthesis regulator YciM